MTNDNADPSQQFDERDPKSNDAAEDEKSKRDADFTALIVDNWAHAERTAKAIFKGIIHAEDWEDICQEGWLRAWKHRGNYLEQGSFLAWLSTILSNCARDRFRKGGGWLCQWPKAIGAKVSILNHAAEVTDLDEHGPAASAGLRIGDIVERVNNRPVITRNGDLRNIRSSPKTEWFDLLVLRGGSRHHVVVTFDYLETSLPPPNTTTSYEDIVFAHEMKAELDKLDSDARVVIEAAIKKEFAGEPMSLPGRRRMTLKRIRKAWTKRYLANDQPPQKEAFPRTRGHGEEPAELAGNAVQGKREKP